MTENDVLAILRDYISRQFPKECKCCGKRYESLADYLRNTSHLGKPMSYDAEIGDWKPGSPIGTVSMASCSCGETLAISSSGMSVISMWRLLHWARKEIKKRGVTMSDLLEDLRKKLDHSIINSESENN